MPLVPPAVRDIDVWPPDTDVLILLLDPVANGRLGTFTKLQLLTGKGKNHRFINIPERVTVIGQEKCSRSHWSPQLHWCRLGWGICGNFEEDLDHFLPEFARQ